MIFEVELSIFDIKNTLNAELEGLCGGIELVDFKPIKVKFKMVQGDNK